MSYADKQLSQKEVINLAKDWNTAKRVMILTGVLMPDSELEKLLVKASEQTNTVVLTERTSNLFHPDFHHYIDRSLNTMPANEVETYQPDLLITIGTDVVSKQIKAFLRKHKPVSHWHIDDGKQHTDTYKSLTRVVPVSPLIFLQSVQPHLNPIESDYSEKWGGLESCGQRVHDQYLDNSGWSDLKAFKSLMEDISVPGVLHLGNSTPVRYAMLFAPKQGVKYLANRGTSGIDGIVSTAAGYAAESDEINTVITGDVSFYYDSNALWNKNLPRNLRIIVINNQGGSIFRIIPGPATTGQMEEYFETKQTFEIEKMAAVFGLKYYYCDEQTGLNDVLRIIYKPHESPVILEIKTPGEKNDVVLKDYFKQLKG
jgi:2-succinyl-5-enolpyruvyl-6-hydroxy-3-cyclohexene-1-carboxylate synthase